MAIHRRRPDNSFWSSCGERIRTIDSSSGFSKANGLPVDVPGLTDRVTDVRPPAMRIFKNIQAWTAPVPGARRRREPQLVEWSASMGTGMAIRV